jgi:hypothetical protein
MFESAIAALVVVSSATAVHAQNAASIPRTSDGHPDFTGIWQAMTTAAWDLEPHIARRNVPAGLGVVDGDTIPYLPAALGQKQKNVDNRDALDPDNTCYLPGVPRIMYEPFPFQIVQTPTLVTMLFEYVHAVRYVFMGTPHPAGPIEWWMGDSRGTWETDTLTVDVRHFNAETWFDKAGNFHSEDLHLVERYAMPDREHIDYSVTVEDPKVFARPWTIRMTFYRHTEPNLRLLEYECYSFDGADIYKPIHAR